MTDGPQYLRRLPHNVEAEQSILGTLLFDDRLWAKIGHRLTVDDFVLVEHRALFAEIAARKAAGQRIDPVLLKGWAESELTFEQRGGSRYLIELTAWTVVPSMLPYYIGAVVDDTERRQLIGVGEDLINAAYSGNGTIVTAKTLALDELTATRSPELGNLIRVADCQGQALPEREWLVPDWLPIKHVTSLYGDGGVGKSLLAQQMMAAHAAGVPWLGLPTVQCPSMGLFAEDDIAELIIRQDAINGEMGIDFLDLGDMHLWSLLGEDATLMEIDSTGRGRLTPLWHEVRRRVLRLGVRLLVVDTAAATFGGNELIRSQVTQFTRVCLGRLALEMNGVVLMCAHPSRAGLASGEGDGASTAWNAGVRSRLYFSRVADGPDVKADDDRRVLTKKKANYARIGDEIGLAWRGGVFVPTDQPAAGGIIGAIEKRSREREIDAIFLACLQEVRARGQQAGDSVAARDRYAPKLFRTLPAGRKCSFNELKLAMDRLLSAGKIRVASVRTPGRNYVSALVEVVASDG